ncbi:acyl-CoA--sterol O-acyltransferase 1-like [Salvia hispanica]|uniref:acyl-CoA--sterol O-acyltransferase 1-like n=1 Tax=Salvia hispanica TaxID=49212 RepID=UPI00200936B7|nr:acyl-CoA--sterol O-acyltransferase 1-like [Salvia hispanica]
MEMGGELKKVLKYWMEGEITSFIKVWLSAYLSLTYCYIAAKMLRSSGARLAAFLPVVCLFLLLPLELHSVHLVGTTGFFLAWLATFKLLMLAFHQGPLSTTPPLSLPRFLAVACLPIKLRRDDSYKKDTGRMHRSLLINYSVKGALFVVLLKVYEYDDRIHPILIKATYSCHVYLCLELILAMAAAMARGLVGAEVERQFNEPYLSTSLQDFWGRRWNLMVTRILRPTVYQPVLGWSAGVVGREWAPLPAVVATFAVSGVMHELIFFYLGRVRPTWEISLFFLLHGFSLAAEIVVKKVVDGRWSLPAPVAKLLTVAFVLVTALWLFLPPLMRCKGDERGLAEVAAVAHFIKDVVRALTLTLKP